MHLTCYIQTFPLLPTSHRHRTNNTADMPADTPKLTANDGISVVVQAVPRYIARRTAAMPYVNGLIAISHPIQNGAPELGKTAPESNHIGSNSKFKIA